MLFLAISQKLSEWFLSYARKDENNCGIEKTDIPLISHIGEGAHKPDR